MPQLHRDGFVHHHLFFLPRPFSLFPHSWIICSFSSLHGAQTTACPVLNEAQEHPVKEASVAPAAAASECFPARTFRRRPSSHNPLHRSVFPPIPSPAPIDRQTRCRIISVTGLCKSGPDPDPLSARWSAAPHPPPAAPCCDHVKKRLAAFLLSHGAIALDEYGLC